MAKLVATRGPLEGQEFRLTDTSILGRSYDADVRVDDLTVSRHHAKFTPTAQGYAVVDLGSGNGTIVNGERIYCPTVLKAGDTVQISSHLFAYSQEQVADSELNGAPGVTISDEDDHGTDSTIAQTMEVNAPTRSEQRLSGNPRDLLKAHTRLKTILALGETIHGELDLNKVLEEIMNGLFRIYPQADRGFILLVDQSGKSLVPRVARTRSGKSPTRLTISRSIRDEVLKRRKGVLVADAMNDQRFSQAQSVVNFRIRSVMCVPLVSNNQLVGLINIDTLDPTASFQGEDLELLTGIANQAAAAVANARMHERLMQQQKIERDMQLAEQVQLSFLPDATPEAPGMGFCASYRAALQVGGDFYDYAMQENGGRVIVAIGDVSGKGVPAALLMARMTSELRLLSMISTDPAEIVSRLNNRACAACSDETFVTFLLMSVDVNSYEVTAVNAGHMDPIVRRREAGAIERIETDVGFPLGVVEDFDYACASRVLEPGDSIVVFTDGVSEAMNGEHEAYGDERARAAIGGGPSAPKEIISRVLESVQAHVEDTPASDDLTLVCFGRTE